jgi:hypothetical protein
MHGCTRLYNSNFPFFVCFHFNKSKKKTYKNVSGNVEKNDFEEGEGQWDIEVTRVVKTLNAKQVWDIVVCEC